VTWRWVVDHLLSGAVPSLIVSVVVWVSHARTRRHITDVTAAQTQELTEAKITGGAGDQSSR
jgi:hypothetical protein